MEVEPLFLTGAAGVLPVLSAVGGALVGVVQAVPAVLGDGGRREAGLGLALAAGELPPVHVEQGPAAAGEAQVQIVGAGRTGDRARDRAPGLPASGARHSACSDSWPGSAVQVQL